MNYKFVFGPSRSGTTLLAAQLGQYTGSLVPPELQFVYRLIEHSKINWGNQTSFTEALLEINNDYSFRNLGLTTTAISEAQDYYNNSPSRSVFEFLNSLLVAFAGSKGLSRNFGAVIEHSPVSRRYLDRLSTHFPNSQYIGIYRDPRAVFASFKKVHWGPNTAAYFCIWWKNSLLETLATKIKMPNEVKMVSYEDLVLKPEKTLHDVANFLNLNKAKEDLTTSTNFSKTNYNANQHMLVDKPISTSRISAWKTDLTETEIAIIEHHCGEIMNSLGYKRVDGRQYSRTRYYLNISLEKPFYILGAMKQKRRRKNAILGLSSEK